MILNMEKNFAKSVLLCYYVLLLTIHLSLGVMGGSPVKSCNKFETPGELKNLTVTCRGYDRIPSENDSSLDLYLVDILDLSDNNNSLPILRRDEFTLAGFQYLAKINLENCKIQTIEAHAFNRLIYLAKINLENNRITSVNLQMFGNNSNKLESILLNGNAIHSFTATQFLTLPAEIPANVFASLGNLQELDLRGNKLQRLDWRIFSGLQNLTHLFLSDNEWECDCHMHFLQVILQKKKINIASDIICKGPGKFANTQLSTVEAQQQNLTCPPVITDIIPIGSSIISSRQKGGPEIQLFANIGQNIQLNCVVDAYPQPEIIWMKNNRSMGLEQDYVNEKEQQTQSDFKRHFSKQLTIFNTNKDDQGTYQCVAAYNETERAERIVQNVVLNLTNGPETRLWFWIILSVSCLVLKLLIAIFISKWRNYQWTKKNMRFEKRVDRIMKERSGLDTYAGYRRSVGYDFSSQNLIKF